MGVDGITPDEATEIEPSTVQKRSRKRSITIFVIVSILNVALLVLLWTQLLTPAQPRSSTDASNTNSATIGGDYTSPLLGKPAPDLTIVNPDGGTQKMPLSRFKGKPVVLNFWASWCEPCNDEAPFLQRNVPKLEAKGITFIGIDAPEKVSDAQAFIKKYGIKYTNVQDTLNGSTRVDYGVTTFPVTVFINRDGVIAAMWNVQLNDQGLKTELAKIAA